MATKKVTYEVGFTGNTNQLQSALKQAVSSLETLGTRTDYLNQGLQNAATAALQLNNSLRNAYNVDTGKLDLIKFQSELEKSKMTLQDYATQLSRLGPAGEEAFLQVAQAISAADLPLKRSNTLLNNLWVTMKNTMRWQLTSSALHGFIGAVQSAYGYSKDLNESLNNIRIVTQASSEDMAKFASEANRAAKNLSTTTTTYTNASLIYYQQGLPDDQVAARTNATIKMANVAGESAEMISQQMTAIWNNFDDGTRSLESYGDAMVKLGAETASSSGEIAEGLEKFAPIASTVGLSFDYAAAALATVTATTRESASIAGTALKTLFSRIEGLTLGETLDDGTDLNKYSQALAKVGIDIKDVSGDLKDMDTILDEMGEKWKTLGRDQQMALAETVAGVRQYTQLVAIMDNWDFMQENITRARTSEGSLEAQAQIYAESWEAARKRVKAAAEDIYDSLINEDFFIGLDDVATPILSGLAQVFDAVGGLNGLLPVAVMWMNKLYGDKVAQSIRDMAVNIGLQTGYEQEKARALQANVAQMSENLSITEQDNQLLVTRVNILRQEIDLQGEINANADSYSAYQRMQIENDQYIINLLKQKALAAAEEAEARQNAYTEIENELNFSLSLDNVDAAGYDRIVDALLRIKNAGKSAHDSLMGIASNNIEKAFAGITDGLLQITRQSVQFAPLRQAFRDLDNGVEGSRERVIALAISLGQLNEGAELTDSEFNQLVIDLQTKMGELTEDTQAFVEVLRTMGADNTTIRSYISECNALQRALEEGRISQENFNNAIEQLKGKIAVGIQDMVSWADVIVNVGAALSRVSMGIQAIKNLGSIWDNDDLTAGEKTIQVLTSLTMLLPTVATGIKAIQKAHKDAAAAATANAIAQGASAGGIGAAGAAAGAATPAMTGFAAAVNAAIWPLTLIALGVAAVVTIIDSLINHTEKVKQETIDASKEAYEATQSEIQATQDLIEEYEDLLDTYQKTGEGKEDLAVSALKVAEALGVEGAAVANLTGDYSALNDEIAKAKAELNSQTLQNAISARDTYFSDFEKAMYTGKGRRDGSGGYNIELGKATGTDVNSKQIQALRESDFYQNYSQSTQYRTQSTHYSSKTAGKQGQVYQENFKFGVSDREEDLVAMYEAGLEAAEAMRKAQVANGEAADETYQELTKWLEKSRDAYEEYKAIQDTIEKASFQDAVYSLSDEAKNVTDYQSYLEYYNKLNEEVEKRVKSGEIEADNVDQLTLSYLAGTEALKKYAAEQQLISKLENRFGADSLESNKEFLATLDRMSEEELQIAIALIPQVSSPEEFIQQFIQVMTQSIGEAVQQSMDIMGPLVQNLTEESGITDKDYEALLSDSHFLDVIEQDFIDFETFRQQSLNTQLEYIRDYYTATSHFAVENLEEQKQIAQEELNIIQAKYSALRSFADNYNDDYEQLAELRAKYAMASTQAEKDEVLAEWQELRDRISQDGVDVQFDITDVNETLDGLMDQLDDIENKISSISQQQIEIAINWDDWKDIKAQIDSLQSFASTMQNQNRLVGDSYQYPINEVQKWLDKYPDLFAQAEVTTDGLITLTQEEVNAYIQGQKDETDANIDAKIAQWKAEIESLEAQKAALQAELKAYTAAEQGKIDVSEMSSEQIAHLEEELTQYQIDCGVDEATAHKNSLEAMGLNEEKFSEIVAEVAEKNAQNVIDGTSEGAQKSQIILQQLSDVWKTFANNVKEVAKAIANALLGKEYTAHISGLSGVTGAASSFSGASVNKTFEGVEAEAIDPIEAFKADRIQALELDLSAIDNAIATLNAKITAAEALRLTEPSIGGDWDTSKDDKGKKTGGSGGEGSTEKLKKDLKEILERYHEITREIEYQERVINKLDKQIERAYGTDRVDLYKKKIEELSKLAELQAEKSKAGRVFVDVDLAALQDLGLAPTINEDTLDIENYTELLRKSQNDYQTAIDAYNAWLAENWNGLDKEQQELQKAEKERQQQLLDTAKELYDDRKKALESYEDSVDTYRDLYEEMKDTLRNIETEKLNEITYKMEVVLDVKEARKMIRDFTKEIAESFGDALTHSRKSSMLGWEQAQDEMAMYNDYVTEWQELHDYLANATEYTDINGAIDALKDLEGNIIDSGEALLDWLETVEDMFVEALDAAADRFSYFTDSLEHNSSILSTIKELYALQGVTYKTIEGFSRLQKTMQTQLNTSVAQAKLQRQWYEKADSRLQQAQADLDALIAEQGENAEYDVRYDTLKKNRDALLEESRQAQEAWLQYAQEAMETAQQMYLDQIERVTYEFGKTLSDGLGLDLLQDKYDHYIETEERYLDKINEAYEVASWYDKLQHDIDETKFKTRKDRLKELQEEIDLRREGNTLSQYDLDILEAKYKVLQAQMALEDAQNNKSELELVRDSSGNWNYRFAANADDVAAKQQELLDAENEWYNLAKQQTQEVTNEIIATWTEAQEALNELYSDTSNFIYDEEGNRLSLTEEALAKEAEIREYYAEKVKYLETEKEVAISDMTEAGNQAMIHLAVAAGDTVSDITGLTAQEIETLVKTTGASSQQLLISDLSQIQEILRNGMNDTTSELNRNSEVIRGIVGNNTGLIDLFDNVYARDLENMTANTGKFEGLLEGTIGKCQEHFDDYASTVSQVATDCDISLDKLDDAVNEVSDSTNYLADAGYSAVNSLWSQVDATWSAQSGYLALADAVMQCVYAMQQLATESVVPDISAYSGVGTFDGISLADIASGGVILDDYSAAMARYVAQGGSQDDATYQALAAGRIYVQENDIDGRGKWADTETVNQWIADQNEWYQNAAENADKYNQSADLILWAAENLAKGSDDFLHNMGVEGFSTGGYTGLFDGGKLAFLHEKELVLNAKDTENILSAVTLLRNLPDTLFADIAKELDGSGFASMALLGRTVGNLPNIDPTQMDLEQDVHITAEFPNVTSAREVEEAFESLTNDAAQWARRRKS